MSLMLLVRANERKALSLITIGNSKGGVNNESLSVIKMLVNVN